MSRSTNDVKLSSNLERTLAKRRKERNIRRINRILPVITAVVWVITLGYLLFTRL